MPYKDLKGNQLMIFWMACLPLYRADGEEIKAAFAEHTKGLSGRAGRKLARDGG